MTKSTYLNSKSSRSHSIFQLVYERTGRMKVGDRISEFRVSSSVIGKTYLDTDSRFGRLREIQDPNGPLALLTRHPHPVGNLHKRKPVEPGPLHLRIVPFQYYIGFDLEIPHAHPLPKLQTNPYPQRLPNRQRQTQTNNLHFPLRLSSLLNLLDSTIRE